MKFYQEKADVYDLFMKSVGKDYNKEAVNILPFLDKHQSILELGAGTGNFSDILHKKGFHIICSDLFEEMLDIAKKKKLVCKKIDMRNFLLDKKVDVILSLFNTLMHNLNKKELESNIRSCAINLNFNGLLIVEINNPELLMKTKKFSYSVNIPNFLVTQIDNRRGNSLFHTFIFKNLSTNKLDKYIMKTIIFPSEDIISLLKRYFFSVEVIEKGSHKYFIARIPHAVGTILPLFF